MGVLTGLRVIELAETPAGEFCGKLLADFGAEVIKIERPGSGSPTRKLAPLPGPVSANAAAGSLFAWLNTNKKSAAIELTSVAGAQRVRALLAGAAVVIDDRGPQAAADLGLAPENIAAEFPELVCCMISPFGLDAPVEWSSTLALNVFHASGWGYHTPSDADPDRPPLKGPNCYVADFEGGLDAAIAVLACLFQRTVRGVGECIDLSEQSALLNRVDSVLGLFLAGEDEPRRSRHAYDRFSPDASYACSDGNVYLFMTSKTHWSGLLEVMDRPDWALAFEPDWLEFGLTEERIADFRARFAAWIADKPMIATCDAAQALGTPLVPLNGAADLLRSPQYRHRGFFQTLIHPVLGKAEYPTVPYLLSKTPVRLKTPAPLLGQHTDEVLAANGGTRPASAAPARARITTPPPLRNRGGPLAGVRVVELTKVWAGPYAGKLLAFLGAEVIKIESHYNMDEMRAYGGTDIDKAPIYRSLNHEILSAQFNLKGEEGRARLRDLIARSDIVMNNLRPGAMERMGFGYEELCRIRPDIIAVSLKMYGNAGPLGHQTGYAPCFAAISGISGLVGYENEPPSNVNLRYGDSTAGAAMALGALAALVHRERTGEGQFVDVSAVEALSSMVGDRLFRFSLTGEQQRPDGNYHPDMAPHGCYPCQNNRWISIAVVDDARWQQLCRVLDVPALAGDARLATLAGRQAHYHELDAALDRLTANRDAGELAAQLRAAGIGAFVSLDTVDLVEDPHLWHRGDLMMVDDAHGPRPIVGPSWRLARSPAQIERGAPLLGEHNRHVFQGVLGLSDAEFKALRAADVVT